MVRRDPGELMQASAACVVLAQVALPWYPLLSGELVLAAGVLGTVAATPAKDSTNATSADITDGVPHYSAHTSVLGAARLGSMRGGSR
ncbi:MAG TPA: hypothetical protein VMU65_15580 [Candidatus Saccharimonadales bacterium]|nr:hypothetical protein [Candidatus Saccharimonadales bacterium]